jgi:sigma-B regulation protein RsbU (phosphoserine phosphatase)
MPDLSPTDGPGLEVTSPDGSRQYVRITESPFLIGRGIETGNHLQLTDRRISRHCTAIVSEGDRYYLEDRGHRQDIFVNGIKIDRCVLEDGDTISFGFDDSYEIIFHAAEVGASLQNLLTRIESISSTDPTSGGLRKLNLLLEATSLLHSQLPLDSVLGTMLDHAIVITDADRGLLLESDSSGSLCVRLARGKEGERLAPESMAPSQTALRVALEQQSSVITKDLSQADLELQSAESVVAQQLRAVVAIPLFAAPRASSTASVIVKRGHFLGVLYLDSRRTAAFSKLDHKILDALAMEAASILDNARLVERERQRERMEQELSIARDIQQALLPGGFRDFPHLAVTGINSPCLAVGGDYFDVFPLSDDRTAFLIADVSGKGLGAALLTTMLQGALTGMTIGVDPARIFRLINRFLCEHSEVGRYATMFFGILDVNGRVDFINAGHPPPLLLRRGVVLEPFLDGSFPVGLIPEADFVTACVQLEPNDTLILFSDGVTEAMDPDEQMFGVSRLRGILAGQQDPPMDHLQKAIFESVRKFTRGASQGDDITVLLVRYRGLVQTASGQPEHSQKETTLFVKTSMDETASR